MSFTPENIIAIQSVLTESFQAIAGIDYVVPSPLAFADKADFFNVLNPKLTQKAIETTLIRAGWLEYLTFESVAAGTEKDHPVYTLIFKFTFATEYKFEKLDALDSFKKRILKCNQEHLNSLFAAVAQFEGGIDITGFESYFDVLRVENLTQVDFTHLKEFEFVAGAKGFETSLQCRVTARNKC